MMSILAGEEEIQVTAESAELVGEELHTLY